MHTVYKLSTACMKSKNSFISINYINKVSVYSTIDAYFDLDYKHSTLGGDIVIPFVFYHFNQSQPNSSAAAAASSSSITVTLDEP